MIVSKIKRGSAEFAILSVLAEDRLYGYQIAQTIAERTAGELRFTLASLYPMLYALEKRGWIAGAWEMTPTGRKRRYYRLTRFGPQTTRAHAPPVGRIFPRYPKTIRCRACLIGKHSSANASLERRAGAELEPEVTEELAHYLEDHYEAGLDKWTRGVRRGPRALAEVRNWPRLARNIKFAREGGEMLKQRIQTLWMPGLAAAILTLAISISANRAASTLFAGPRTAMFVYSGWLLILTVPRCACSLLVSPRRRLDRQTHRGSTVSCGNDCRSTRFAAYES